MSDTNERSFSFSHSFSFSIGQGAVRGGRSDSGGENENENERESESESLSLRMMLVGLVLASGCAIGGGSAYVGQWRPHDEVEFEACLVDDAGRCTDRKEVVQHVPGRRFWGAIVSFPAMGVAKTSHAGLDQTVMRVAPTLELLRGTGRWAYGLRSGVVIDAVVGMDKTQGGATVVPLEAIGRVSVIDRLSLYGGVGFAPFAQSQGERAFSGEHVLAGLQYALSKTHSENFIILSLEADTMFIQFDDPYRSSGLTGSIGLFF